MVNFKIIIPIIIIIIIVASLIIFTSNEETTKNEIEEKRIESGPFAIDKAQYNVGEKIFFDTDGLKFDEKGTVEFLRPINDTHHKTYIKIPFDGIDTQQFNYYFEPRLQEFTGICSMDDIAGNWKVKFSGTQYEDINFEILNQVSSWDDRLMEPVC
uniref:Uncharacterized protein n=1 Tax=uncultured marine thaumarchaeote SAT1000_10_G09 TaxID=1456375 RepID=A0A075I4C3_9ARCH|nr:hypothetical protein [uncultured marine thaumarchaeote SAT1000_10_G09]